MLLPIPIPLVVYGVQDPYTIAVNIATMLSLLFCLTVTSVAYFKVFRIIREHQQQIHASEISRGAAQPIINIAKYKKSVKTILYILAIFYTGYFSVTISMGLMVVFKYNDASLLVFNMSVVLALLSSSLNPALYLWRMKEIRNEVKRLVNKLLRSNNEVWTGNKRCRNKVTEDQWNDHQPRQHIIQKAATHQGIFRLSRALNLKAL